jgi:phage FluMu gp28-like protein
VVIDEAAFHDKLGELLKAALALLIWGGKVRVISTHNGERNPFNELINDIRAGKRAGSVQRITFKEAVGQGLYRRVCLRLGKDWSAEGEREWMQGVYAFYGDAANEELDVVPSQGSGAWLPAPWSRSAWSRARRCCACAWTTSSSTGRPTCARPRSATGASASWGSCWRHCPRSCW